MSEETGGTQTPLETVDNPNLTAHPAIIAAAHNIVVHFFEQEISPASVIRMSEVIMEQTEGVLEQARRQRQPEIACKAGCFWCCCAHVDVTTLEALYLSETIRANWDEAQIAALKARIAAILERRQSTPPEQQESLRLFCPLLIDARCSIYPARPLACRGWVTRSAEPCRQNAENPEAPPVPVPFFKLCKEIAGSVIVGIQSGLEQTPLQNEIVELVGALHIALEDPCIVDRWLTGERVFPTVG